MSQPSPKTLTVRTPGKLILSGEHAVVYGNPAIAMAVNRYTETTISEQLTQKSILFNLLDFRYHQSHSLPALRRIKQRIKEKYQKFLQGEYEIRDVLKEPFELLQYAVTHIIDHRKGSFSQGMEIRTESNIPIGCGMGSSAAAVVSVMYGVTRFSQQEVDLQACYHLAREAENVQHGYSSGVDVYLVLHGGCIRFEKGGEKAARPIPQRKFLLVNTGPPAASTGECVAAAARHLQDDKALLAEFDSVTQAMDTALQKNNTKLLLDSVRNNHRLLMDIEVVPKKVQRFVAEIERAGGAAKICGAGSVHGDAAGAVLVISDEDIADLVHQYGYQSMEVYGEAKGTHVLC